MTVPTLTPGDKIAIRTGDDSWRVVQPEARDTEIYGELPADAVPLIPEPDLPTAGELLALRSLERARDLVSHLDGKIVDLRDELARVTQARDQARALVELFRTHRNAALALADAWAASTHLLMPPVVAERLREALGAGDATPSCTAPGTNSAAMPNRPSPTTP